MKKPELLAPAGNMEKLKVAVHYGADAVYLGGEAFGLRNLAGNFTTDEMATAISYCHNHGVKIYLTLNAYLANHDLPEIERYLDRILLLPLDAYIVSDPGVLSLIREKAPAAVCHLSTQANTTNWRSALFWQQQGISRINLARETTLEAIKETREHVSAELEIFVHGALCISYSGRCLLSSIMSNRDANKGECTHPCRWGYALMEETRPGEYYPVIENGKSTFIFNSRDLCLIDHIPELVRSGADSLKIEGRMKGINYVASVVRVYRNALDRFCDDPETYTTDLRWKEELAKLSHRGYTTGFLFGSPKEEGQEYDSSYIRTHDFVGIVKEVDANGNVIIDVRGKITSHDQLEFTGRNFSSYSCSAHGMLSTDGIPQEVAHPNHVITLKPPFPVDPFDLVRKLK
jgi:putative protease